MTLLLNWQKEKEEEKEEKEEKDVASPQVKRELALLSPQSALLVKCVSKVLGQLSDSRTSYICHSDYQHLCEQLPKLIKLQKIIQCCHVMLDECVLELCPEMGTRGRLINLISAFLHILSVALH